MRHARTMGWLAAGAAMFAVMSGAAADTPNSVPDFSGVWARGGDVTFFPVPGEPGGKPVERLPVDSPEADDIIAGKSDNPILQPWARAIVQKNAEHELALMHVNDADDVCWPSGVPQILNRREAVELLQEKDRVVIIYQRDHQERWIWLNQPHSAHPTPSWYGESVGHYEGDTLVVDTIGQKVAPMSMTDNYGTPHTAQLHVVERYRVVKNKDGKGLEVKFRVVDPGAFTMPWSGMVVYRASRNGFEEVACAENNRSFGAGSTLGAMPEEKTPSF